MAAHLMVGMVSYSTRWRPFLNSESGAYQFSKNIGVSYFAARDGLRMLRIYMYKKLIEKSRECLNRKPQPTLDTKRKRK